MLIPLTGSLEAVLFAAGGDGLQLAEIARILQLSIDESCSLCKILQLAYEERESGLAVVERAGRWLITTSVQQTEYLRRMALSPTSASLSNAAMEVLSIVAYQQPVSRLEVESIRGVQSDRSIATLVYRRLIAETGRLDTPGRPILYGTTDHFLSAFGLRSLADLPALPAPSPPSEQPSLFDATLLSVPRD